MWEKQIQFVPNREAKRKERVTNTNRYYLVDEIRCTWYLKPNTILERDGIVYETNSFGLRDVEFPLIKSPNTLRIVCLGDSVTYGQGVRFEETYEQQLEKKLKIQGIDARVINAGIGAHRTWQGLERLEKDVIRFSPDMVVISFGLNDGALSSETLWEEWKTNLGHQESNLKKQQSEDSRSTRPGKRQEDLIPSIPIGEYKEHLRALITLLQKRIQAHVYLMTFNPISDDYQRSKWIPELRMRQELVYAQYRDEMLEVGQEMGLKTVDVYPRFEKSKKSFLESDGIHPNPNGMAVYAKELYKRIIKDLGVR